VCIDFTSFYYTGSVVFPTFSVHEIPISLTDNRLSGIQIGLTNVSFTEVAPSMNNTERCAYLDYKYLVKGETRTFDCIGKAQYLVLIWQNKDVFNLCEVEVHSK
jgi:hypothetical protein